jgi:F-type H+-transporting ATPase subunit a
MSGEGQTAGEYIKHHLQNLTFGKFPEGHEHAGQWGLAHNAQEAREMGFWAIHVDTMFWSIILGVLFLFLFRKVAKMQRLMSRAVCRISLNGLSNSLIQP